MELVSRLLAVLLVIFSIENLQAKSENVTPCTTRFVTNGQCVPIEKCRNIYHLVYGPNSPTTGMHNYVKQARCTLPNVNRSFCCEPGQVVNASSVLPMEDCGPMAEDRIANGNAAKVLDYPWMAVLTHSNGTRTDDGCGGTLINKRYVLTAAHCIPNTGDFKLVNVRLGEHTKNQDEDCNTSKDDNGKEIKDCAEPPEDFEIESSVVHPNYYNTAHGYDIGLIRLNKDVVMKDHIIPICLPVFQELRTLQLKTFKVTGWGLTEKGTKSDVLLMAHLPLVNNVRCQENYTQLSSDIVINEKQICAGGQNKVDSCVGDSGGPLGFPAVYNGTVRFVQFGIVSYGVNPCGYKSFPGVYTRVTSYMDWILVNMEP